MQRTLLEVAMRGVLAVLVVILLFPAVSFAKGGNTYFEIKGGQYKATGDLTDRRFHNSSNIELSFGHRFFKYFAAEVSYGHYKVEGDLKTTTYTDPIYGTFYFNGHEKIDVYPLLLSGKFLYPVGDDGYVYLGGGVGRYKVVRLAEYTLDDYQGHFKMDSRSNDTVNGWHYMLGTMYDVNSTWTIGLEYKEVKTQRAELKDNLFGVKSTYKTDVDGRMISGFIQLRF